MTSDRREERLQQLERLLRLEQSLADIDDLDRPFDHFLQALLTEFDAERCWLLHPCDPEADSCEVVQEATRDREHHPVFPRGARVPMNPVFAAHFRDALASRGVVVYHPGAGQPVPPEAGIYAGMIRTIWPKAGQPWLLGVTTVSPRACWSEADQALFDELGQRLADRLSLLLLVRELKASEARFRLLAENISDLIWMTDPTGRPTYVSPSVERLCGYTVEEALAQPTAAALTPESYRRAMAQLARSLLPGGPGEALFEVDMTCKDGSVLPVEVSASLLRDAAGKPLGVLGVSRDIRERRAAQAQLERKEQLLLHAQKMEAVGRLAGGVAHDFNNMLTPILCYAELLLDDFGPEDPHRADVLEIQRAAESSRQLIAQLLAIARQQPLQRRTFALDGVLERLEPMLRRTLREHIELEVRARSRCWIRGDETQIEQALLNLTVNAAHAMPEGGRLTISSTRMAFGELKETLLEPLAAAGIYGRLRVEDDGVGMSPEVRAHAFDPFFTTKGVGEGSGLGLSMVHGIVRQHGGAVTVESTPGAGSRFDLYFPAVVSLEVETETLQPEPSTRQGDETIVLVEDEPAVLQLTRTLLSRWGYEVLSAASAEECLERLRDHQGPLDLLLTDVIMPRMNGRQLYERLSARHPGLKVLYMSGYTADILDASGGLENATLLQKPFDSRTLAQTLRRVLEAREPGQDDRPRG